jgi:hypothetical protein
MHVRACCRHDHAADHRTDVGKLSLSQGCRVVLDYLWFGCSPQAEAERATSLRLISTARRSATCGGKIKVRGRLRGKSRSRGPVWGLRELAGARVLPGHALYQGQRNRAVIHGKEKVYGSIP